MANYFYSLGFILAHIASGGDRDHAPPFGLGFIAEDLADEENQ